VAKDIVGNADTILKEIKKPGPVFVYAKLTSDDTHEQVRQTTRSRCTVRLANTDSECYRPGHTRQNVYLCWDVGANAGGRIGGDTGDKEDQPGQALDI
jgi:hypothetical protein